MENDKEIQDLKENESKNEPNENPGPVCLIVLGMAGSGKTTFVKKVVSYLNSKKPPFVVNLDPACRTVPYPVNVGMYIHAMFKYFYPYLRGSQFKKNTFTLKNSIFIP